MQKEVNALRAPLLALSIGRPPPLVGVALRAPSGLLGDASIPLLKVKPTLRVEFVCKGGIYIASI